MCEKNHEFKNRFERSSEQVVCQPAEICLLKPWAWTKKARELPLRKRKGRVEPKWRSARAVPCAKIR